MPQEPLRTILSSIYHMTIEIENHDKHTKIGSLNKLEGFLFRAQVN